MIHIIVGDMAAANLNKAMGIDENLVGDIVVLKDTLGIGGIVVEEDKTHDEIRTEFWRLINPLAEIVCEDEARLQAAITKALAEEEPLCFWMSPCVSDMCAYYWILTYTKQYPGLLHTINIVGLPFINDKGQLFYPNNFSQILPTEFIKTKRLLKEVTIAEYETEGDEWQNFQMHNTMVRVYDGGKSVKSKDESYFDTLIINAITAELQKGSKIVSEALKKTTQSVSHHFLEWRLRILIESGGYFVQGDLTKGFKDFEVKFEGNVVAVSDKEIG